MRNRTQRLLSSAPRDSIRGRSVNTFISYRVIAEDIGRCRQIRAALEQRGIEVHGDWELNAGPDYKGQLHAMIRAADAFVVLMSPASVTSEHVNEEITYAAELKKKILPVLITHGVNERHLRPELASPQWTRLRVTDDFTAGVDALVHALETDFDLAIVHTWLTQRAEAWESRKRLRSALLNSRELKEASDWLPQVSANTRKFPNVTPLQQQFITASEMASARRSRIIATAAVTAAVTLAALGGTAAFYAVKAINEARKASQEASRADRERDLAEKAATAERVARVEEQRQRQAAIEQKEVAEQQRRIATAERDAARRQVFANAAYALAERDPTLAVQFAKSAGIHGERGTGASALLKAVNTGSWLYSHRIDDAWDADLSADGSLFVWIDRSHVLHVINIDTGKKLVDTSVDTSHVRLLPSGNLLTWSERQGPEEVGIVSLLDPSGEQIGRHHLAFVEPTLCPSGRVFIPSFDPNWRASNGQRMQVHSFDSHTAAISTFELPPEIQSLGLMAACLPNDAGIVVVQTLPGFIAIAWASGHQEVIQIPEGYYPSDVAIHLPSRRIAIYLAGAIKGVTDAVAWLQLAGPDGTDPGPLQLVSLPDSPGFDSGGVIAFLPDGRAIVASTDGWARLVKLDDGEQVPIAARKRAVDRIGVIQASGMFVMARRSGRIAVFDPSGMPIGQLLGEFHSDGLNPVFERIVSDKAGDRLLTVSRNGARIWRRPRFQMTVPHTASFRPFAKLPASVMEALSSWVPLSSSEDFEVCRSTEAIKIDDLGQLWLCIQTSSRNEYLDMGLTKDDIDVKGFGPVTNGIFHLVAEEEDRLFVLSPAIALRLVEQEERDQRLWQPDVSTLSAWLGRPQ